MAAGGQVRAGNLCLDLTRQGDRSGQGRLGRKKKSHEYNLEKKITNVHEDVEKSEPLYGAGGEVKYPALVENTGSSSKS